MAARNFEIIIKLTDNASKGLDDVEKKVKKTGKSANESNEAFKKFAKTLAVAGASVALFSKAISKIGSSIEEGADIERLTDQYERVLGPKSRLFQAIDNVTTTGIDRFEAMRQGISLANLGIIKSSDQLAMVMGEAGTAAKLAGKDSSEGLKSIGDFLKTGETSQLQFLNLIAKTNPALQAEMTVLNHAGGMMGHVISTQARLALGKNLLAAATRGHMHDERDLMDILKDQAWAFHNLRSEIGQLLGAALGPFIRTITGFVVQLGTTIEHLRKTDKTFVFMVKSILVTTAAVTGLVGVLLTLKAASAALTATGIGMPLLLGVLGGLGVLFFGLTSKAEKFTDRLKFIGAVIKGVYELVTSFDEATGTGKMSKSVKDVLDKAGLTNFVVTVSRVFIATKKALGEIYDFTARWARRLFNVFQWVSEKITNIFTGDKNKKQGGGVWGGALPDLQTWTAVAKASILALGALAAKHFLFDKGGGGFFSGLLSKVPLVGRLFGGGKPDGSRSRPFYVVSVSGPVGGLGGAASAATDILTKTFPVLKGPIDKVVLWFNNLILKSKFLSEILTHPGGKIVGLIEVLKDGLSAIPGMFTSMIANASILLGSSMAELGAMFGAAGTAAIVAGAVAIAAAIGVAIGKAINWALDKFTQGETKEGFKGNLVERGMFNLFADDATKKRFAEQKKFDEDPEYRMQKQYEHAKKMGWDHGRSFDQYKLSASMKEAGTAAKLAGKDSGEKSQTVIPQMTEDPEMLVNTLGESISQIQDKRQRMMAETNAEAIMDRQAGKGMPLTSDDFAQIMGKQTNSLLDPLLDIRDNTAKNRSEDPTRSRR